MNDHYSSGYTGSMGSSMNDSPMSEGDPPEYCFVFVEDPNSSGKNRTNGPTYAYFMQQAFGKIELFNHSTSFGKFNKNWILFENLHSFLNGIKNTEPDDYVLSNSQDDRSFIASQIDCCSKYIFVVDSFHSQCYKTLIDEELKIIGPLVILYWAKLAETDTFNLLNHLRDIPSNGLFSKCMTNIEVYFSKDLSLEPKLVSLDLLHWMDGKVTNELGMETTHVVADLGQAISSDPAVKTAVLFNLPVLPIEWIINCWESFQATKKMASDTDFIQVFTNKYSSVYSHSTDLPKLLNGMVIGYVLSVFESNGGPVALNKLHNTISVVNKLGGTMVQFDNPMHRKNLSLILHPDDIFPNPFSGNGPVNVAEVNRANQKVLSLYESSENFVRVKRMFNKDIPLISIKWLFHVIVSGTKLPLDNYKIQIYPETHSFSNATLPSVQQLVITPPRPRPVIPAYGTVQDRSRDNFHFGL